MSNSKIETYIQKIIDEYDEVEYISTHSPTGVECER